MINSKRKQIDYKSLPHVIQNMIEQNTDAANILDKLIETKGESITLSTLILLDDMNIRGIQLMQLYIMCDKDIDKLYNKIINITPEDIRALNTLSAPLCAYKALYEGNSLDREKHPEKYIFTNEEREKIISKKNNQKEDLYPTVSISEALKIIKDKDFYCGYKKEYIVNHDKETYWIFYNKKGDILYTTSSENQNLFLLKDSKLIITNNIQGICEIDLKDHPFETYKTLNLQTPHNNFILPIIKTIKSIQYKEKYHTYISCVIASIYDMLVFETTYEKLDNNLKKIYEPLLKCSNDMAYDEIIKHLASDDGIQIAMELQNILGYNLDKNKLLKAKERFYQAKGIKPQNKKRFLSNLISDNPHTKEMNNKIIEILMHDRK